MKTEVALAWAAVACLLAGLSTSQAGPRTNSASRASAPANPATASPAFFLQQVQPVLEAKCFGCHGEPKDREGELDARTLAGLLKGGQSGKPALVPGRLDQSRMFQAVLRKGKLKMPPKERNKLNDGEIDALRSWILAGAPWAEPDKLAAKPKWEYKPEDIWAFQPVQSSKSKVQSPKSKVQSPKDAADSGKPEEPNPIDALIEAKLKEKGLKRAPAADRATLIRRASYDLTGLPPTPEEVEAFATDKSPRAFEKVIERLLASPRYGEQWGRHWLDVVRYADTDGFSNDYERPNAWRYRDYVIRSFNTDKPYDRFVVEQVAGDELVAQASDATRNTQHAISVTHHASRTTEDQSLLAPADATELFIATGMLRMGPWEHTAMSVAAVTRQLFLDDVTHNVSASFLGLTVGCARCHDHKFDPIPTRDYYRLQSVYAPAQFETRQADFLPSENTGGFEAEIARVQAALKSFEGRHREIRRKHEQAVKAFVKEKGFVSLKDMPLKERPPRELGLTPTDQSIEKTLDKRIEYCQRELQRYQPKAFSVSSGGLATNVPTPTLRILVGGSIESPGDEVGPGVLTAVIHRGRADAAAAPDETIPQADSSRRLALAKWIASPQNPLTARVIVNRIWQWHFGQGLAATANNFGKMGKRPTHPELLDYLANYFMEHGWSIKAMHRLILRSAAYQQSARHPQMEAVKQADPEEKLLSHFAPRRLTAEELRDSMLFVSGELSATRGGPPVFPEINLEAALQPRHIMGSLAPPYRPSPTREQRNRRTIYTAQIRTLMNPLLQVFNEPVTDVSCERREATTVTPQVFALYNSQCAHDSALALAARVRKKAANPSQQVHEVFCLTYGRSPTDREKQLSLEHLEHMIAYHCQHEPSKFGFPRKVVRSMVEEMTGDSFEFEEEWDMSNYEYNLQPTEVSAETRALADLCLVVLNSNEFVYVY
jgi:cytochrome c553